MPIIEGSPCNFTPWKTKRNKERDPKTQNHLKHTRAHTRSALFAPLSSPLSLFLLLPRRCSQGARGTAMATPAMGGGGRGSAREGRGTTAAAAAAADPLGFARTSPPPRASPTRRIPMGIGLRSRSGGSTIAPTSNRTRMSRSMRR